MPQLPILGDQMHLWRGSKQVSNRSRETGGSIQVRCAMPISHRLYAQSKHQVQEGLPPYNAFDEDTILQPFLLVLESKKSQSTFPRTFVSPCGPPPFSSPSFPSSRPPSPSKTSGLAAAPPATPPPIPGTGTSGSRTPPRAPRARSAGRRRGRGRSSAGRT
ncbi:hypothetical protein P152DRAFT_33072 [Eremomyces bilateralis CBS 781.70]|uniref:Uncharacterized protein n=1 Tax=Eremomyces bilateralis CBS 781.70 TaxID=1392243 RepID=A0A6G1G3E9_9PEZI|nr:uncharacterized protein P152DRAFT_33072 [Eremomyces bilateralis CBS 781.70]KAF1812339.1 hypothetical protein P152DRAFT_33072 [Eremomyces bilateralis CBS 781.70]